MCVHERSHHDRAAPVDALTPQVIVEELDNYIVGQHQAKRAVAIALRNRWRRQQLSDEIAREILPKNIIMIGPTGVGKTEIARRLSGLAHAPFLKVEASKYTEVGYHGRDVESMIRDLMELSVEMVRSKMQAQLEPQAEQQTEERLLDCLYQPEEDPATEEDRREQKERTREKLRDLLRRGKLEGRQVEIEITHRPVVVQGMVAGGDEMGIDMQELFEQMLPSRSETRHANVADARQVLLQQELERLIDKESLYRRAIHKAENSGIIFIDELDKVAGHDSHGGPDVSREGVQRDLLPVVEGSTVPTRYGMVKTDHILFIAAGAFNVAKPSDLIPELQGRFPIRVELDELSRDDFVRILTEPKNALTTQYQALLSTEDVDLAFADDAIQRIAEIAEEVNQRTVSIGARRLQTVMEKLLEDLSFDAPAAKKKKVTIDREYVDKKLSELVKDEEMSQYIL